MTAKYWIIVASKDHVQRGVEQGFAQACHGKAPPLKRLNAGDWIIYYSSKEVLGEPQKCQCFTAIGQVTDSEIYSVDLTEFTPFRRNIDFSPCESVSILPLIPHLSFIQSKRNWGGIFRFGMLQIPQTDFEQIADRMLKTGLVDEG